MAGPRVSTSGRRLRAGFAVQAAGVRIDFDAGAMGGGFSRAQEEFFEGFIRKAGKGFPVQVFPAPLSPGQGPPGLSAGLFAHLRRVYGRFPAAEDPAEAARLALDWARLLLGGERFARSASSFLARETRGVFFPKPQGTVILAGPRSPAEIHVNDALPEAEKGAFFREAVYLLLSQFAHRSESLVLHGAGAVRDGLGYVFLGLSGAGKSTVASLSGPRALSDDGLCVRKAGTGFFVESLPFTQAARRPARPGGAAGPFPLGGLYFLVKGGPHRTDDYPAADALGDILHNYIHFFRWFPDAACRKTFRTAAALVRKSCARRLHFSKDEGFWDVIIP